MPEEKLTVQEAAEYLSVSQRTIWNYLKKGDLTKVKEGAETFILLSEVEFITNKRSRQFFDSETQLIVDKKTYEALQASNAETVHTMLDSLQKLEKAIQITSEMGFRIGQLETEKRFYEQQIKLLEDLRPARSWWRRIWKR